MPSVRGAVRRLTVAGKVLGGWSPPQAIDGRPNPIHLWEDDPEFSRLFKLVHTRTIVDQPRCFMLYQLARQAGSLPGDAAEVGVYQGGTAKLLARTLAATGTTLHLFDTFAGMPAPNAETDVHREGDFGDTSLDAVTGYLRDCENVAVHPGVFPTTANSIAARKFCFVHVDADIYESVRACCEFFYPRLVPGGLLVFDDYGFISCPGAKRAVDEFFADDPAARCYLPTGQCVVRKR